MWKAIFNRYWQVCLFKETPANTPHSFLLLILSATLFFLLIVLQWSTTDTQQALPTHFLILGGISLIAVYFVYTFLLLAIYQKKARITQVVTTLLMTHWIIHLFAFPLLLIAPVFVEVNLNQGLFLFIGFFYLGLTLALTVWQFLITVHIYKQSLEVEQLTAVLASLGLLACTILAVSFW